MTIILLGLLSVITASAQSRLVTLHVRQQPMTAVFGDIEKQTKMHFLYNIDVVNVSDRVTVNADKENITKVLDDLFRNRDISYVINDNQI
ncbi:MAG: STN domain-containing protein, partial [Muribaculaceae bacterium]|nr:STN domain-containing protein [Muribaculaceae bacterium]